MTRAHPITDGRKQPVLVAEAPLQRRDAHTTRLRDGGQRHPIKRLARKQTLGLFEDAVFGVGGLLRAQGLLIHPCRFHVHTMHANTGGIKSRGL
ncbi:MAG: hypothetical protein AB2A00_15085 [Myxococcota bacterium]